MDSFKVERGLGGSSRGASGDERNSIVTVEELDCLLTLPFDPRAVDEHLDKLTFDMLTEASTDKLVWLLRSVREKLKLRLPAFIEIIGQCLLLKLPYESFELKKKDILMSVAGIEPLG